jgi:uncharacterized protein (TIGR03437 family)
MRFFFGVLAVFCVSSIALAAATNRIAGAIDPANVRAVPGNVHRLANGQSDQGEADPGLELDHVMLLIKPSAAQQADLDQLLRDQQNASSPSYHQWLTPEQFADRFGLSVGDHSKIVAWLTAQGLTVNEQARGRNWLAFSGSAAQISRALHTSIHRYVVNGKTHFANATGLSVPAAIADLVGGFLGLNDFLPEPQVKVAGPPDYTSGSTHYLAPGDWSTIYDVAPLTSAGYDGTGQSIVVVGQSDILTSDISSFRTDFGLPSNTIRQILFGSDPGYNGAQFEANLDLEWSGAIAPHATIYYVISTDAFEAFAYAVSQNIAPVISNSYALCENDSLPSYRSIAQQANAQGITISSAAGDSGGAGCDFQNVLPVATHGPSIQFPANLPEVTAMGGSMFSETLGGGNYWGSKNSTTGGSALSYIPEMVWNENDLAGGLGAGGGGASASISKPDWQTGPGVPSDGARDVPDLSLSSGAGHDGYLITYNGNNLYVVGGTSAAAPTMSGVITLLNQYLVKQGIQKSPGLGNINPQLYRLAQTTPAAFHDIFVGNNDVPCGQGSPGCSTGFYGSSANVGYDLATGLGSIDANVLVTSWNQAASRVVMTLTSSASTATVNDMIALTATVAAASGSVIPTGTVNFAAGGQSLGSVTLAAVGAVQTASMTVPVWQIGAGSVVVTAEYAGDSVFSTGGAQTIVKVSLPTAAGVAAVIAEIDSPVFAFQTGTQPYTWQVALSLANVSASPAIVTGFTIDGVAQSLTQVFPSPDIAAHGSVSGSIVLTNLAFPVMKTFTFTGSDLSGTNWTRSYQVAFRGPLQQEQVNFDLWATPLTIQQNPGVQINCLYSQQVTLDEITGYELHVVGLLQGSVDISQQIPAIFGTTRLAPWGSLQGTLCWNPASVPSADLLEVVMQDDFGDQLEQELNVNFAGPSNSGVKLSASPTSLTIAPSPLLISSGPTTFTVNLSDKTQPWTASVFPANRTTSWLTLSQYAGTGPATVTLSTNPAGFELGAYRATIVLQSPNSVPQWVAIPVMFVNAQSPNGPEVTSVGNAISFTPQVSPGSLMAIYGTNLGYPLLPSATGLPLTVSQAAVSVTVNGWPAPIFYASPTQINVQVPYEVGAGSAVLGIDTYPLFYSAVGGYSAVGDFSAPSDLPPNGSGGFQFQISPAAPGILTSNGSIYPTASAKQGSYATMYVTGTGEISQSIPSGVPVATGTSVLNLPTPLLPINLTVGGVPALIQFEGMTPGTIGLIQVNFVVPTTVAAGVQPVVITAGGYPSVAANLTVTSQ